MLAKFENGYFLEVYINEYKDGTLEYLYNVYDEELNICHCSGWTEYRNIEMYCPMNEIDYILTYCNPKLVKGKYELMSFDVMKDYKRTKNN